MIDKKKPTIYRPFAGLKNLIEKRKLVLPEEPVVSLPPETRETPCVDDEKSLFQKAMADVKALKRGDRVEKRPKSSYPPNTKAEEDTTEIERLEDLIQTGAGFDVSLTPEYVEGVGRYIHPSLTKRLYDGDFSIQEAVDLHGLSLAEAKEVFDCFLKESIARGKKAVLIVHGRGLSSPAEPVLKSNVVKWMRSGPWRKWITAYSSARLCDGGAGATYILLRNRPQK